MATIYRCDRCSKESPSRKEFARIEIPYVNNYSETDEQDNSIRDLCVSCIKELHQWISPKARKY
jgi:hypothetical protein